MKVFISGPMSGKPNYNREAFFKAQEELESHGHSVWNPAWLAYPDDTEFSKDDMHAIDNEALRHCDAIYMLKGWEDSNGAWLEHSIAIIEGFVIMYEGSCSWDKDSEKGNTTNNHNASDDNFKAFDYIFAWKKWKSKLPDSFCNNKLDDWYKLHLDFDTRLRAMKERIDIISKNLDDYKEAYMHLNNADEALERRIEFLERKCKGIGSIVEKHCDDNKTINNSLTDLNIRLKAIEKRLGI